MNGVRRFLGAASTPTTPDSATTNPLSSSPPTINGKSSWPSSPPHGSSRSPVTSPKNTVSGLAIRNNSRQHQPFAIPPNNGDILTSSPSRQSGTSLSPFASPTGSQASITTVSTKQFGTNNEPFFNSPPTGVSHLSPGRLASLLEGKNQQPNTAYSTRDELLLDLLASEAVVDSREFEILSSEEVEELKREYEVLSARVGALDRKLSTETKIRDAAVSLSKINTANKRISKQTEEQLAAANRKVEAAQKEFWRVSERANEVNRKLLEHRAGVLSISVRTIEKKIARESGLANGGDSGYDTPNQGVSHSPTTSSVTSASSSSKSRFDGPHFFAGHTDSVIPQRRREVSKVEVTVLEDKFRAATDALAAANQKTGELARELSLIRLEKEQVETTMEMELQNAEDKIASLEKEIPKLEMLNRQVRDLQDENTAAEKDRVLLAERARMVEVLEQRIRMLEEQNEESVGMEQLTQERERSLREVEQRDAAIRDLQALLEAEQKESTQVRESGRALSTVKLELDEGLRVLQSVVQMYNITVDSTPSLPALVSAVSSHLTTAMAKQDVAVRLRQEWEATRQKLEDDLRMEEEKREAMSKGLEKIRRERDQARKDLEDMESRMKEQNFTPDLIPRSPSLDTEGDVARLISILQPIWAVLPSPESRAAKTSPRSNNLSANSPTVRSPSSPKPVQSVAELDVRSLKALYDGHKFIHPSSPNLAPFNIEAFAQRVQALIADDRALIERLLRFAQAHDLLKQNAERAQKLAQESNLALEVYQKQVRTLEERNLSLASKQFDLQDEVNHLQETVELVQKEKHDVEAKAVEQAETCRQLTQANNTLSTKALRLAEEAANAPVTLRRQLDECQENLRKAEEEIQALRMSDNDQRIALMDELNSMQTENGNLRAQLRALKR